MPAPLDELTDLPEPSNKFILDDIDGGQKGLLQSRALGKDLKVEFAMWPISNPAPGEPEKVELYWNDSPVDSKSWTAPVPETDLFITVPVSYLQDGEHKIRYTVWLYTGQSVHSRELTLTIDSKEPVLNLVDNKLILPPQVIEFGVTAEYLATHGDKLQTTVPTYATQAPGDVVTGKWSDPLDGTSQEFRAEPLTSANYTQPVVLPFPGDLIRTVGEGLRHATYQVEDRAGNPSLWSTFHPVEAALKPLPLPAPLPAPKIPQADDGRIDRLDAGQLRVEIPQFDNALPEDRVVVTLGTTVLDPHYLGSQPVFPVPVNVPWPQLKSQYDFDKGGDQDLKVSYKLMRRSLTFPAIEALPVTFNLSKVGPENPDEPTPLNPNLGRLMVRGLVSALDNTLTPADYELDAIITLKLYQPANKGERIRVYWWRTALQSYVVSGDELPGADIQIKVPWITIRDTKNHPELRVYYTVFDEFSPNAERSLVTLVDVSVLDE